MKTTLRVTAVLCAALMAVGTVWAEGRNVRAGSVRAIPETSRLIHAYLHEHPFLSSPAWSAGLVLEAGIPQGAVLIHAYLARAALAASLTRSTHRGIPATSRLIRGYLKACPLARYDDGPGLLLETGIPQDARLIHRYLADQVQLNRSG